MKLVFAGIVLLIGSYSMAEVQIGKISGTDNYGNACWVNISEAKNESDPLIVNHKLVVTFNYSPESFTLIHPLEKISHVITPAPLVYSGRSLKPNETDPTSMAAAKALVSITIDKNHNATSFGYWDNDGGPKDFKRRDFRCKLAR